VNSFVFEARARRVREAQLKSVGLCRAERSVTKAPLAPPTPCICLASPWRRWEREIEAGAASAVARSTHASAAKMIARRLPRTAAQGNR
jgi:hypothetical protein